MQPPLILRRETAAARNFLHLLLPIPEKRYLGADRAAVARRPFELEFDPRVFGRTVFLYTSNGPF
jgi:hypothetical protein